LGEAREPADDREGKGSARETPLVRQPIAGEASRRSRPDHGLVLFMRLRGGPMIFDSGTSNAIGVLGAARKEVILKAIATTHGNRSAAAKLLGLEAKYFLRLMKSLRIE